MKGLNEFRIATNGLQFRVEELCEVGFWKWKHKEWKNCLHRFDLYEQVPVKFSEKAEAMHAMRMLIKRRLADQLGWIPIDLYDATDPTPQTPKA
jgi:hypothetical protein